MLKIMTCRQLGGACDEAFRADTFEGIAELSQQHGLRMAERGDEAHLAAMAEMQVLMKQPAQMQAWLQARRDEFEALAND